MKQHYSLNRNGSKITISYDDESYGQYGWGHIEISTDKPLPITETGYKSIFVPIKELEKAGNVIAFVQNELEEGSQTKAWKDFMAKTEQPSLFV